MQSYALINNQNIVENVVVWDGASNWVPPENTTCVNIENLECGIGWTYNGSTFIKPEPVVVAPVSEPTREELLAQLQALTQQIQSLT